MRFFAIVTRFFGAKAGETEEHGALSNDATAAKMATAPCTIPAVLNFRLASLKNRRANHCTIDTEGNK